MLTGTFGEADHPDDDADHVAGEAGEDVRLDGEREAEGPRVGARLEEELRAGVEQHAGQDEGEADKAHGFLTKT
jgi:hypothetical protein